MGVMRKVGVVLYGLASAACGVMDLGWGTFDAAHQPIQAFGDHIPGVRILAYIAGIWMLAGGLAMLWRWSERAGGAALAIIYLVFAVFWLPRVYSAPHLLGLHAPVVIGVLAGVGIELVAFVGGALVYAWGSSGWTRKVVITRWVLGLCSIDFGVNHLDAVKESAIYVPKWIPLGQPFWVVLTGICFVLAGLAIVSKIQDVLAARMLGLMFLVFNAFALPQFIFADPKDHAAWGGNAFNLVLVAACWIYAEAVAGRGLAGGRVVEAEVGPHINRR
jgi:uncharacterized membrane protein